MADYPNRYVAGTAYTSQRNRNFNNQYVTTGGDAPTVYYFQRVWDAGLGQYCYYTKTVIDPAPLAAETTPNYTGAISAHSVVRTFS
jgi:hypothetical protein